MTTKYRFGKCLSCGVEREVYCKDMCTTCYNKHIIEQKPKNFLCPVCKQKTQQYGIKQICKACYMKDCNSDFYKNNKENIKNKAKENYDANKEIRLKQMKEYDMKNKEARREYFRKYHEARKLKNDKTI